MLKIELKVEVLPQIRGWGEFWLDPTYTRMHWAGGWTSDFVYVYEDPDWSSIEKALTASLLDLVQGLVQAGLSRDEEVEVAGNGYFRNFTGTVQNLISCLKR